MTRLSNRQYPMLHVFIAGGSMFYMRIHEAQKYDQRPFRSMLIQKWIAYSPARRGFHITKEGRQAWEEFHHTSIQRQDNRLPLTRFFNPLDYGQSPSKLYLLPKRKVA